MSLHLALALPLPRRDTNPLATATTNSRARRHRRLPTRKDARAPRDNIVSRRRRASTPDTWLTTVGTPNPHSRDRLRTPQHRLGTQQRPTTAGKIATDAILHSMLPAQTPSRQKMGRVETSIPATTRATSTRRVAAATSAGIRAAPDPGSATKTDTEAEEAHTSSRETDNHRPDATRALAPMVRLALPPVARATNPLLRHPQLPSALR